MRRLAQPFLAIPVLGIMFGLFARAADAQEPPAPDMAEEFFGTTQVVFDTLAASSSRAAENLATLIAYIPSFPSEIGHFFVRLHATGFNSWSLLFQSLFYLGIGLLAELVFRTVQSRIKLTKESDGHIGIGRRFGWFGANMVGLSIFACLGGWPLLMATQQDPVAQTVVITYLTAILAVRVFTICSRMVLAPFYPEMRIVHLDDAAARRLYWWVTGIAAFAGFSFVTASLFHSGAMEPKAVLIFVLASRSALALWVMLAFFANRPTIAQILRYGSEGRERGKGWSSFAGVWHLMASIYVTLSWFATSILLLLGRMEANKLAIFSFMTVMLAIAVCLMLDDWATRVDRRNDEQAQFPTIPSFAQFFARMGRAAVVIVTLLLLLRIWSGPWHGLVAARTVGGLVPALTQLLITTFIAYILWQLVLIGTERVLCRAAPRAGESETARQTRIATLLPLMRNSMLAGIAIIAGMIGLSAIGVDVVPLFAGAGVIGLAVGMGSQALVKDIVSGLFFLLDDAFRVGDYVDTGVAMGTIERAGIRSLQIRHHLGALHTVPFGEIQTIANHSRDWVIFKMDFRVPFDTDTHALRKKFKALGQTLLTDETFGHLFVEPLKSSGVVMMDDSAMIVRASFKSRPGEQFQLRRVVYEAVRKMFKEEGIDVAVREVRVRSSDGSAAGAGAQAAVEEAAQAALNTSKPR